MFLKSFLFPGNHQSHEIWGKIIEIGFFNFFLNNSMYLLLFEMTQWYKKRLLSFPLCQDIYNYITMNFSPFGISFSLLFPPSLPNMSQYSMVTKHAHYLRLFMPPSTYFWLLFISLFSPNKYIVAFYRIICWRKGWPGLIHKLQESHSIGYLPSLQNCTLRKSHQKKQRKLYLDNIKDE